VRLALRVSLRKTKRDDFRFLTRRLDAWSYSCRRSSSHTLGGRSHHRDNAERAVTSNAHEPAISTPHCQFFSGFSMGFILPFNFFWRNIAPVNFFLISKQS